MSGPTARDYIIRGARQHTDKVAVIFGDSQWTFGEIDSLSNRLAQALISLGAGHHSRVGLLVNNGPWSVPVDFACVKSGINRVPLNARLSVDEHARMLSDTQCALVIHGPDLAPRARELAARLPHIRFVGLEDSVSEVTLADLAAEQPDLLPEVDVAPDDVILTLFTSGTTGVLKAAQHTQSSFAAIASNVLLNILPAQPDDVMLHAASMIHASGVFVLPFWLRGGKTVVLPGFEPGAFFAAIARYGVTSVNVVPTMLQMLLDHPQAATADLSTLRRIIYGASPMPRPTIQRAIDLWGQHLFWQYYGQTEFPLAMAVLRPEEHVGERLGACGQVAVDVELRLLDADGREVPHGEAGEIVVRGAAAVAGYFNAPELTAEMFRDGWVHTRDVGVLDADGYLFLRDRTSDMIISGGYNVYPREVEDILLEHPAVRAAAVIGRPHPKWVEAVTAVVTLQDPTADGDALRAALIAHVGERVAAYKKPQEVIVVDSLPTTAVGKLDRKSLRARFAVATVTS